jgi:hypothetical protein
MSGISAPSAPKNSKGILSFAWQTLEIRRA